MAFVAQVSRSSLVGNDLASDLPSYSSFDDDWFIYGAFVVLLVGPEEVCKPGLIGRDLIPETF